MANRRRMGYDAVLLRWDRSRLPSSSVNRPQRAGGRGCHTVMAWKKGSSFGLSWCVSRTKTEGAMDRKAPEWCPARQAC